MRVGYSLTVLYSAFCVVLNLETTSTLEREIWAPVSITLFALVVYVMRRTRFHHFWIGS